MKEFIGILGIIVIVFLLAAYMMTSLAFVQVYYWDWFIAPLGFDLPRLSISQWIGVNAFIGLLKPSYNIEKSSEESKGYIIAVLLFPFLAIILGAILKLFI